jgi:hypothetical protein
MLSRSNIYFWCRVCIAIVAFALFIFITVSIDMDKKQFNFESVTINYEQETTYPMMTIQSTKPESVELTTNPIFEVGSHPNFYTAKAAYQYWYQSVTATERKYLTCYADRDGLGNREIITTYCALIAIYLNRYLLVSPDPYETHGYAVNMPKIYGKIPPITRMFDMNALINPCQDLRIIFGNETHVGLKYSSYITWFGAYLSAHPIVGQWYQSRFGDAPHKLMASHLFSFHPKVLKEVDDIFYNSNLWNASLTIGVHIRTGGAYKPTLYWPEVYHPNVARQIYGDGGPFRNYQYIQDHSVACVKHISSLLESAYGSKPYFFFTSDNRKIRENFIRNFKSEYVVQSRVYIEKELDGNNIGAIIDQLLLSRCKHVVLTVESTYSMFVALLTENKPILIGSSLCQQQYKWEPFSVGPYINYYMPNAITEIDSINKNNCVNVENMTKLMGMELQQIDFFPPPLPVVKLSVSRVR